MVLACYGLTGSLRHQEREDGRAVLYIRRRALEMADGGWRMADGGSIVNHPEMQMRAFPHQNKL
jgi:hypothetical protein